VGVKQPFFISFFLTAKLQTEKTPLSLSIVADLGRFFNVFQVADAPTQNLMFLDRFGLDKLKVSPLSCIEYRLPR
jgi:hypothetical protein